MDEARGSIPLSSTPTTAGQTAWQSLANGSTTDWIRVEKALVFFEQDADPGITRAVANILVNLADRKTARAPHIDLSAAAAAIRVEDD